MKNEELNKILLAEVEKGTFPGATYALVSEFGTFYGALGFKSLYPTTLLILFIYIFSNLSIQLFHLMKIYYQNR